MVSREDPVLAISTTLSIAVVLGLLTLALLPFIRGALLNRIVSEPVSTQSDRRPHQVAIGARSETWTEAEIVRAREECIHVLKSISAEIDFLDPIKNSSCGLPSPVRLRSLGSSSRIVFDPPVETNCRLMAALYRWTANALQPEAKKIYKSTISRIVGASSYSCRNIYFLPAGNLSQHAFATAIDIGAFQLADGRMVTILKGWGPTTRDATKLAKRRSKSVQSKSAMAGDKKAPKTTYAGISSNSNVAKASLPIKPSMAPGAAPSVVSRIESDRDGAADKPTAASVFLRNLHKGACLEFKTVLGPEANDAHRNHFHFDLNPSRGRAHCN